MHRPAMFRQRLALETLEDRLALAGNVVAVFTEGRLTILGDDQANGVNICYDVATATHRVTGFDLGGSMTTINGEVASPTAATFSGVKHLQIWLGAGDDQLDFGAADQVYTTIAQKLAIDMGSGNDQVELGNAGGVVGAAEVYHRLYVNKGIYVDLGAGDDLLEVANVKTNKSLIVKAGDGNDAVTFATEFTPAGATEPVMFPVSIKGNLHLHMGLGDDTLTVLHARVGDSLRIVDPAGAAIISMADVAVAERLNINTGHQNDQVILDFVGADDLNLHTNGGEDNVKIEHSRFKRMNVHTGGGSDDLKIRSSRSSQYTYLEGGDGGADLSLRSNSLRGLIRRRMG